MKHLFIIVFINVISLLHVMMWNEISESLLYLREIKLHYILNCIFTATAMNRDNKKYILVIFFFFCQNRYDVNTMKYVAQKCQKIQTNN